MDLAKNGAKDEVKDGAKDAAKDSAESELENPGGITSPKEFPSLADVSGDINITDLDFSGGFAETALKMIGYFVPSPATMAYAIHSYRGKNIKL